MVLTPGPLEEARKLLREQINEAATKGVGIRSYASAFSDLETMVKTGQSSEKIESRLKQIQQALEAQLSERESMQIAPLSANTATGKPDANGMSLQQARDCVLELVNKERVKHHLTSLRLDKIASAAAQAHSDEMAQMGYVAHWDSHGQKPDQRYTEQGGGHNVGENIASYFGRHNGLYLDSILSSLHGMKEQRFSPKLLGMLEKLFMDERPPHDLHRLQTLRPEHNKLGVGVSYSETPRGEWFMVLDQEFVDAYGDYSKLPTKIDPGKPFEVSGSFSTGVTLHSVSIRWEPEPKPMTRDQLLNCPDHYDVPDDTVGDYFPNDGNVKIWIRDKCQHFSVKVIPKQTWKAGLYYVMIFAAKGGDVIAVSNRTTRLSR
jgi:uncharacterized protein YkwD